MMVAVVVVVIKASDKESREEKHTEILHWV